MGSRDTGLRGHRNSDLAGVSIRRRFLGGAVRRVRFLRLVIVDKGHAALVEQRFEVADEVIIVEASEE